MSDIKEIDMPPYQMNPINDYYMRNSMQVF